MNQWIQNNYSELRTICEKISKIKDVDDLLHSCLEQFLLNQSAPILGDKERLFFFARIVRNNFHSKTSHYFHQYNKYKFSELQDHNAVQQDYEEDLIDLNWVNKIITFHKKGDLWYYARLFELFIDEGCSVSGLSKRTTIPLNSVSRDINKYRRILKNLREDFYKTNGM